MKCAECKVLMEEVTTMMINGNARLYYCDTVGCRLRGLVKLWVHESYGDVA